MHRRGGGNEILSGEKEMEENESKKKLSVSMEEMVELLRSSSSNNGDGWIGAQQPSNSSPILVACWFGRRRRRRRRRLEFAGDCCRRLVMCRLEVEQRVAAPIHLVDFGGGSSRRGRGWQVQIEQQRQAAREGSIVGGAQDTILTEHGG